MNRSAPKAILFDAYGTLFDVYSVATKAEELFPGCGAAIGRLWRDKQIEYTRLVTTSDHGRHYRPFWELTEAALRYAILFIANNGVDVGQSANLTPKIDVLMAQYRSLTAFPDARAVLLALRSRGVVTGVLSNGNADMLNAAVQSAGLGDLLDHIISVDPIRKYKTHPDAYALGVQATGEPVERIGFVSSNSWDALAATWFGYTTLWVNRQNAPFEQLGTLPTYTAPHLSGVLQFFD